MTSHCASTVYMREESENVNYVIRKWEELWYKMLAEHRQRWGSSDVRWKTAPQTSSCNRKHSVTNGWDVDEAERRWCLASVSAGWCSSSHRYVCTRTILPYSMYVIHKYFSLHFISTQY